MHKSTLPVLAPSVSVLLALAAGAFAASAAQADMVVNIKGFGTDGAGVTSSQPYPLPPGTLVNMVNPVLVDMKAGDYLVSDAWGESGALYDAWNYNLNENGTWDSHFYIGVQQGSSGSYALLLDGLSNRDPGCANPNCSYSTESEASQAFLQTAPFHLHVAQDEVVAFSSTDYYLLDNAGGISLSISANVSPVPEPAEWELGLASLIAFGAARGRRFLF